nr:hypothetical protein [Tanacetum cinerariifolium]
MSQDRQTQNVRGNGGNHFGQHVGQVAQNQQGYNAWQNGEIQGVQNAVQNTGIQNGRNQNGLVVVPGIANQSGSGNVVAARAEGDLDEIEEVNANCILMANLQQASTSGTQHDKALVYDTDGSAEVQLNDNYYDIEIFNMFTQEELYTDLLEPIPKPQLVPQNDNHVTSVAPSMVQSGGTIETSFAPNKETRAHQETVYRNLVNQVTQVNMINCNMRETNAKLKSELARYKIQEQRVEISQEKYDKLEKCYQKSVYQEQCFTRKINALHLSSAKQITTLNDEISNLNKQLSKEKSYISSLMDEKKKIKCDSKTQEDKFHDKEVELEAKIKDLENILLKRDQTVQTMHMLNPKPDSFYHPNQKLALGYPNPSYLRKAQLKQQSLYNGVFVPQMTKSKEELFLSNVSNIVTVSKTISIPNEDLSDDTTPSVARKFLNEVKSSLVTPQRVVKRKMTLEVHNWSSSAHKEVRRIISHEIAPIINQVDARVQNFEIQFLQEATKFVRDFKSLAKEADESLDKQKSLELKIERLLQASVNHDIMSIVQNGFVDVPSDLRTELDRTKEKLKLCIIKKEKEYACTLLKPKGHSLKATQGMLGSLLLLRVVKSKKNVTVEDHHRTLLLSKNPKTMSSECNNIKLAIWNDKSEIDCDTYTQCMVTVNHDACLPSSMNAMNSHANKLCVNVLLGTSSFSSSLCENLGTVCFGNDHIAAILGYGDLKWGNITITRVYFVEGLGHNLFSVGQFCDADLEVAFRRNTCFIRDLDGVDLLKGNRFTNLYTINLYDMASASPICLMARATPTKSTEFKNQVLKEYFDSFGITHETSTAKTPQQNGVIERRNRTALCYLKNDREDIGKLGTKGDIGFFIGYSANSVAYKVNNRGTKKIMETINVTFDELSTMAFKQNSSRPGLQIAPRAIPAAPVLQNLQAPTASMSFQDSAPVPTNSSNTLVSAHNVDATSPQHTQQQRNLTPSPTASVADNVLNVIFEGDLFVNPFGTPSTESAVSSTQYVDPSNMHTFYQPCIYALTVSIMEPKTVKEPLTIAARIKSMQKELHQFIRLDVWELIPSPDGIKPLTLKWLFKNKHDEENPVIRKKTHLVVRGYQQEEGFTVYQMDVKTAFLHGSLKEDMYVCQPKGTIDPTLFTRRFDDDILVVQVYVDDIIFGSTDPRYATLFSDLMKSRFKMSMIGEIMFFLGLQVNQSPSGIFINQSKYVHEILKKYGLNTCDIIGTPMDINDKLDLDQIGTPVDATKYHSMIGALMYLTSS